MASNGIATSNTSMPSSKLSLANETPTAIPLGKLWRVKIPRVNTGVFSLPPTNILVCRWWSCPLGVTVAPVCLPPALLASLLSSCKIIRADITSAKHAIRTLNQDGHDQKTSQHQRWKPLVDVLHPFTNQAEQNRAAVILLGAISRVGPFYRWSGCLITKRRHRP
jgi:hypothetical protein